MPTDYYRHAEKLQNQLQSSQSFVIVTLAAARGSAPQVVGAKAIITAAGLREGTVGGGKVEARAIAHAQQLLAASRCAPCQLVRWNLQTDIGMTCGGEIHFLFEVVNRHDWQIAVFGAGHVAQSLVPLLLPLPCAVTCLDSRREWLNRMAAHPRLNTVCCEKPEDEVPNLAADSFFVLMTQGHATDLPVLAKLLTRRHPPPYIGVIGSRQKAKVLQRDLAELQIDATRRQSFHCPIGLSLGNNTPPEIAISILAQLIQERDRLGVIEQKSKAF